MPIFSGPTHFIFEGWQPGIQETAADWDEDWDKFEDEGMPKITPIRSISVDSQILFDMHTMFVTNNAQGIRIMFSIVVVYEQCCHLSRFTSLQIYTGHQALAALESSQWFCSLTLL